MVATGDARLRVAGAEWMRRFIHWRWAPLLTVLALTLCTQVALFSVHPVTPAAPDSREYLVMAERILHGGAWTDPRRTPGYPAFLALIFLLAGGQHLGAVMFAQCAIFSVATVEVYLLAQRITRRPWIACLATAPVALNIYMLDWAYSIRDETLAFFLIVTLFLAAERLTHGPRPGAVAAFTLLGACVILERPMYVLVPAVIVVALSARSAGLGKLRQHALALGLSLALIYGCVLGYAALNNAQNGYFGLSYVGSVNLFGKVIEYRMQSEPVPPAMQPLQRDANTFAARGGWQVWDFARDYGYDGDNYAEVDAFARSIIIHHPLQFAAHTVGDVWQVLRINPGMDARGRPNLFFNVSRLIAYWEARLYLALPLVIIWLVLLLRKGWRDPALFTAGLLALVVIFLIGMESATCYSEFYRLRVPIDWACLLVFMLVALDLGGLLYQRLTRRGHSDATRLSERI